MSSSSNSDPHAYEPRPDAHKLTAPHSHNVSDVDYEPYPEKSIKVPAEREKVVKSICALYSGSASEEDMQVYDEKAIYDDPWSYCDTRYKIAGQWYGECDWISWPRSGYRMLMLLCVTQEYP